MKHIPRILLLAFFALAVLTGAAFAEQVTVQGQGSTERNALHDAMRNAIEEKVGTYIDSRTYVENYQVINDRIYSQSAGYITSYDVLRKDFTNGIWTVTIRADVRSEQLRADLMSKLQKKALIGANMQDPRIGVMAVDSGGERCDELENILIAGLQNQGFSRLIDLNQIDASILKRIASADASNDASLRNTLTTQFHVDYMVTAKINRQNSGLGGTKIHIPDDNSPINDIPLEIFFPGATELNKSHVDIAVRMMNVNTGEILFAGTFAGDGRGRNAAEKAMSKATQTIVSDLSQAAIEKAANPEQHITVIITHGALGTMSEATRRISNLPGVSHVFTRSTSYGNIEIDVDYYGTAYDLASEMEANGIAIKEMSSEYIKI